MDVSERIATIVAEHGVNTVFGYPGETNMRLLRALGQHEQLRLVQPQLEDSLAHAACGYAKASGQAAVVCTGGGASGASLLPGILDAQLDSAPMVILSGQVRGQWIGRNAVCESYLMGMSAATTKHAFRIDRPEVAGAVLRAAFTVATTGRPGVVLVEISQDVLEAEDRGVAELTLLRGYRPTPPPSDDAIARLLSTLSARRRPVLLLGGGAADSARAWTRLAERLRLPVVTSFTGKGVFPETHPQALGVVGSAGRKAGMYALKNADWLLAVGCRFSNRLVGADENLNRDDLFVCHVDVDNFEIGKIIHPSLEIHADAGDVAERILAATPGYASPTVHAEWLNRCAAAAGFCLRCVPHSAERGVHPKHAMDALNDTKRSGDVVVVSTGLQYLFSAHFLLHQQPRTFLASAGADARGSGLPRALGAALAARDQRLFLIDGEVSFSSRLQEMALARQLALDLRVIVLDNAGERASRTPSLSTGSTPEIAAHTMHEPIDYLGIVRGMGVDGYEAPTIESLRGILATLGEHRGPSVIRVPIPTDVQMSPTMPLGGTFSQYGGICMSAPGVFYTPREEHVLRESAFGREDDEP